MLSLTQDARIADLIAAWPLVLLVLALAFLIAMALGRAAHKAHPETSGWGKDGPTSICRAAGHHYLRRETGWLCSHCGDEVRHYVAGTHEALPAHRTRELTV